MKLMDQMLPLQIESVPCIPYSLPILVWNYVMSLNAFRLQSKA